jgi:excisionase family DNA binding protein
VTVREGELANGWAGTVDRRRALLDARGAGNYTGLGERYIRRLRSERKIPCIRIGGRVLFDPDDLDNLIEKHREPAIDVKKTTPPAPERLPRPDRHRSES